MASVSIIIAGPCTKRITRELFQYLYGVEQVLSFDPLSNMIDIEEAVTSVFKDPEARSTLFVLTARYPLTPRKMDDVHLGTHYSLSRTAIGFCDKIALLDFGVDYFHKHRQTPSEYEKTDGYLVAKEEVRDAILDQRLSDLETWDSGDAKLMAVVDQADLHMQLARRMASYGNRLNLPRYAGLAEEFDQLAKSYQEIRTCLLHHPLISPPPRRTRHG